MALPHHNTDHSDISTWGIAAMVCGAIAIVSINLGALVPENIISALHASRLEGGNVNQLRTGMAEMRAENLRLTRDTRALLSRLNLLNDDSVEVIRRLAAVERNLPLLIGPCRSTPISTAAADRIHRDDQPRVYEADGGTSSSAKALFSRTWRAAAGRPADAPLPGAVMALRWATRCCARAFPCGEILAQTGPVLNGLAFVWAR